MTLRYYAAASAAAGVESETLEVPDGATLARALEAARAVARSPRPDAPGLEEVLRRCSYLVNETAARDPQRRLAEGDLVDVLPPFAGG
ncbi:MoaD/ThiS family protein [Sinomonas sp. 5-5]|uniref:Molybdopterin synthase sulfur carrier subunit n=1 Tax=Sinomonas terrae TaxID=2908838 RepID=A0ABS9U2J4_9MICC|nr:MoaD/ThiS family protein [Sinomonas terrae]